MALPSTNIILHSLEDAFVRQFTTKGEQKDLLSGQEALIKTISACAQKSWINIPMLKRF